MDSGASSSQSVEEDILDKVLLDKVESVLSGRTKDIFQMLRMYTVTYTAKVLGIHRDTVYYHLKKIKRLVGEHRNT